MRRLLAACLTAGLLLWAPDLALAQGEGAAPAVDAAARARAREHNEAAKKAFELGRFREAAGHYEKAYEAKASPVFLFNLGQCYRRLGDLEDLKRARFYLRGFLRSNDNPRAAEAVNKQLAEIEEKIAKLEAAKPPAPATAPTPAPAPAPDPAPAAKPKPSPGLEGLGKPKPAEPSPTVSHTPIYKKWWFWTLVGAVVVGGTVGGVVAATTGGDDRVPQGPPISTSSFPLSLPAWSGGGR